MIFSNKGFSPRLPFLETTFNYSGWIASIVQIKAVRNMKTREGIVCFWLLTAIGFHQRATRAYFSFLEIVNGSRYRDRSEYFVHTCHLFAHKRKRVRWNSKNEGRKLYKRVIASISLYIRRNMHWNKKVTKFDFKDRYKIIKRKQNLTKAKLCTQKMFINRLIMQMEYIAEKVTLVFWIRPAIKLIHLYNLYDWLCRSDS